MLVVRHVDNLLSYRIIPYEATYHFLQKGDSSMSNTKMLDELNEQIKHEYYSSYLYLSMSAYCAGAGFNGFAHWLRVQADEELLHGNKIYDYILTRSGTITLAAIPAPPHTWKSPLEVFEASLEHEKFVTSRFNDMADLAIKSKDHATNIFLQWFINEQVEEEDNFTTIINNLKLVKGDGRGLLLLDRELGARPAAAPIPATAL